MCFLILVNTLNPNESKLLFCFFSFTMCDPDVRSVEHDKELKDLIEKHPKSDEYKKFEALKLVGPRIREMNGFKSMRPIITFVSYIVILWSKALVTEGYPFYYLFIFIATVDFFVFNTIKLHFYYRFNKVKQELSEATRFYYSIKFLVVISIVASEAILILSNIISGSINIFWPENTALLYVWATLIIMRISLRCIIRYNSYESPKSKTNKEITTIIEVYKNRKEKLREKKRMFNWDSLPPLGRSNSTGALDVYLAQMEAKNV
jgi:hypothetical protein